MNGTFEMIREQEVQEITMLQRSEAVSPQSRASPGRKRKYDEMEADTASHGVPVIDLVEESTSNQPQDVDEPLKQPMSKRRRLNDENLSTLGALSQSGHFSDVTFRVGDEQFRGLKAVFAINSRVFQKILFPQDVAQAASGRFVDISDISVDAFKFLRDSFYDLNPKLVSENVVDVLVAAELYGVESIEEQCQRFLSAIESVDDLLSVLKQIGDRSLMEKQVRDLMKSNVDLLRFKGTEIIASDTFKSLPFCIAKWFIQSDDLCVEEEALWTASKHWLPTDGPELKQMIRFCRMDTAFIFSEVKSCGILDDADLASVYEKMLGYCDDCVFNCKDRFVAKGKGKRTRKASKTSKKKKKNEKEEKTKVKKDKKLKKKEKKKEKASVNKQQDALKLSVSKKPEDVAAVASFVEVACSSQFNSRIAAMIVQIRALDAEGDFFSEVTIPGYADVVKQPMHFGQILEALNSDGYATMGQVKRDIALIWSNCYDFNGAPDQSGGFSDFANSLEWSLNEYLQQFEDAVTKKGWIAGQEAGTKRKKSKRSKQKKKQ